MINDIGTIKILNDEVNYDEVDFSYGDTKGSIRQFKLILSEKIDEPKDYNYWEDESIYFTQNKNDKITGWYRYFDKIIFEIDIKEDNFKEVARAIANGIAKINNKQLRYDILSTKENEHGQFPTLIKNKLTKSFHK